MLVAALLLLAAGCRQRETRFDVVSFRNASAPERFTERFETGSFAVNAQGNWDLVFEIAPEPLAPPSQKAALTHQGAALNEPARGEADPPAATQPAPDRPDDPPPTGLWMSQLIHIQVFWVPHPGRTFAESSQTNANISYCLMTGENVISYEGAGFVFFKRSRDGKRIEGKVESATLVPARFAAAPFDLFGPCRLTATFKAEQNRRHVVSVLQRLRRKLGPPVTISGPSSPSASP